MSRLWFTLVCIVCLLATAWEAHSQTAGPARPRTKLVVDMSGRTVEIPAVINRIAITCYGGASQEIAALGGSDRIVAQPSGSKFPQLSRMYPRLGSVPDAGSFNNVNVEYIISLKPDVVVASVYARQGNRKIESAGIPVVVVTTGLADISRLLTEFTMMGKILGEEQRAGELVRYWNKYLSLVQKRVMAVPESKRKKVLYLSSTGSFMRTEGRAWWGHYFITASGGINVSRDVSYAGEITMEQILNWDPDAIIVNRDRHHPGNMKEVLRKYSVHRCPTGAFWWDRPSPEAILGVMWLAKSLYPQVMADIDLKKETRSFYRQFYGYTLTDGEYAAF